ncbi:MAG: c-type cytochrome biogenesis protein CcmI [Vibrio sp.]
MTLFWIGTVILTLCASLFVVYPLLKPKVVNEQAQRDDLNKAFYKDRLKELETEDESGIVENKDDLVTDLKASLLDDIPQKGQSTQDSIAAAKFAIPSLLLVVVLSYGLYTQFGASKAVKDWQVAVERLPLLANQYLNSQSKPLTQKDMEDLILGLRTTLQDNPEQLEGWLFLGQLGLDLQSPDLAIGSLKHAQRLAPTDKNVMLSYARALTMSDNPSDQEKSLQILNDLMQYKDVDPSVYSLLAFNAFEKGDFKTAADYWQKMLDNVSKDDPRYSMIEKSIAMAKMRQNGGVNAQTASPHSFGADEKASQAPAQDDAEPANAASSAEETSSAAATAPATKPAPGTVQVTVNLDPKLALPEQGFLIVSVHPASGAPMPIAAARYPIKSFPVTLTLDDANSMMQGQKVSELDSYIVKARIDADGDVGTKKGDLYGESDIIDAGNASSLTINQQYN